MPGNPGRADDAGVNGRHRWTAAALVATVVVALASCGEDKPAICGQVDELRSSIDNLRQVDIRESGLNSLTAAVENVEAELRQVGTEAESEYKPQVDSVKAAASQLSSSVSAAVAAPTAASLAAVGTAVRSVDAAFQSLQDAVADSC
jgi:hypothetical protein